MVAGQRHEGPARPGVPASAAMVTLPVMPISLSTTSSMALIAAQDSSAALSAASIAIRSMPVDQKRRPPASISTLVGRSAAQSSAQARRRACAAFIPPL